MSYKTTTGGSRRAFIKQLAVGLFALPVLVSGLTKTARAQDTTIRTDQADPRYCPGDQCGWSYSPTRGDPDGDIPPGVAFEDLPHDWFCPVCGTDKADW